MGNRDGVGARRSLVGISISRHSTNASISLGWASQEGLVAGVAGAGHLHLPPSGFPVTRLFSFILEQFREDPTGGLK